MPHFYVVTPLGLEAIVERELRAWLPSFGIAAEHAIVRSKGGLTVELPLTVGFALNRVLKTPSRILLRLADFGCRDFPKLFRKVRGLEWDQWLANGMAEPEFQASTHNSRLRIKRRIEETCADAVRSWQKNRAAADARVPGPTILVRFVDDICTISLDTSGEHLHKRGVRVDTPLAPIRENLAAAALLALFADEARATDGTLTLLDPMCGSATFLLEAMTLGALVPERTFAYESFPCVREGIVVPLAPTRPPDETPRLQHAIGWDNSADAVRAARANLLRGGLDKKTSIVERDIFSTASVGEASDSRHTVVICNPPYGERLRIDVPFRVYYSQLFAAVEEQIRPLRAAFILPAKARFETFSLPALWHRVGYIPFDNGGLAVVFHLFEVRSGQV